ncbi:winged helix-turn-helix domain-containing protein, partial [bacterium]|nr:winged helix-turn-helix domain-containing protein [bacterium]
MTREATASTFGGASYSSRLDTLVGSDGLPIKLRVQCLKVFRYLASAPDTLFRKEDIVHAVWGDIAVSDDSLVQCISEIRKALGDTERNILKTMPRRGYMLVSDKQTAAIAEGTAQKSVGSSRQSFLLPRLIGVSALIIFTVVIYNLSNEPTTTAAIVDIAEVDDTDTSQTPTLSIDIVSSTETKGSTPEVRALVNELKVSLSRYRTMRLVDDGNADYRLTLETSNPQPEDSRLYIDLSYTPDQSSLIARGYDLQGSGKPVRQLAVRIAAAVASLGIGAISEHLLATSRLKPIDEISRDECYANGFGCVKCSGEEDNVTKRAEACLAHLLESDPEDARAWGLQATIHAHQYLWANTLPEPLRSTPALRGHFRQLAVDAATKA